MYKWCVIWALLGFSIQADYINVSEKINKSIKECLNENNIDPEEVRKMLKNEIPAENNTKFIKTNSCFLYKSEIIENDEFDVNMFKLALPIITQFILKVDLKTAELLISAIPEECFKREAQTALLLADFSTVSEKINQSIQECVEESNLDLEVARNVLKMYIPPESSSEFMQADDCFLHRSEIIKNDKLDLNTFRLALPTITQFIFETDSKTAESLTSAVPEECFKLEGEIAFLLAVQTRNCIMKSIVKAKKT
ncbi:hypothetical protein FQR65_LT07872 [Abscondita terminalis]|nr:hypothetical protein FQR65_LT07872 [Abscondita terminalis]